MRIYTSSNKSVNCKMMKEAVGSNLLVMYMIGCIHFWSTDEKIDCFSVSFLPVRAEIELHNRRYWDTVVSSLQSSIVRDVGIIEKFTTESTEILSRQPQTVDEIGEANAKHAEIMKTTPQVTCFICYTAVQC